MLESFHFQDWWTWKYIQNYSISVIFFSSAWARSNARELSLSRLINLNKTKLFKFSDLFFLCFGSPQCTRVFGLKVCKSGSYDYFAHYSELLQDLSNNLCSLQRYRKIANILDLATNSLNIVTICAGFVNSECFGHLDQEITAPYPILSSVPFRFRVISDAVINIPTFPTLNL